MNVWQIVIPLDNIININDLIKDQKTNFELEKIDKNVNRGNLKFDAKLIKIIKKF
ncbi:hypothetical protein [[Mycoplasma] phocae]|uniref:hypothetical protein n=1 Tax=[Mycoplasma] phocae TaxID=142651 RepID=UPI0014730C27|nr:hypothetical protein [[Mycoplasma] phocae]